MSCENPNHNQVVNLKQKLETFSDHWSPKIINHYNDNDILLVKVEGEFVWHSHKETDDLFFVLDGEINIELRDKIVTLKTGEMFVVPSGVEHRPVAKNEAHIMIIEPSGTPNTGNSDTAVKKDYI